MGILPCKVDLFPLFRTGWQLSTARVTGRFREVERIGARSIVRRSVRFTGSRARLTVSCEAHSNSLEGFLSDESFSYN